MELKNKRRALSSIFVSLALLLSMVVTTVPGQAQTQNTLEIAKYVNVSGTSQCGTNPESSVYSGKVTMKVPMTEVMKNYESSMKSEAVAGHYPHGEDGPNTIAYVTYDVKFPSNVDFGSIRATETSSFISRVEATPKNNNQVSLKMTLVDENWQGIYNKYLADKANPNDHTVDIEIPYTVRASSNVDAKVFEGQFITASGEFTFHPSARLYDFIKKTFESDIASKPFVSGMSSCFSQPVETTDDLEGDLLIGNDTQHDKVYEARKSDALNITGTLNVKPIKDRMKALENQYPGAVANGISLSDLNTSFTATMTLPEGMEFVEPHEVELIGPGARHFKIVDATIDGKVLTVKISLAESNTIDTYRKLADKINEVGNILRLTVKSVKFDTSSRPNTEYTINGTVAGDFSAKATNTVSGKVVNFKFKWLGKQSRDGADFRALNSDNIRFTLMYKDTDPQIVEGTDYLEGDILIGNDTQHDKVYEANKSDILDITGALNVKPIKQKLGDLENQYVGAVANGIDVSDIDTSFTASITLPDGMEFTSSNPPAILGGVRDKFKIAETRLSGKTLTVKMSLKSDGISTYQQLANAVNAVDDTLKVTVKGVKFSGSSRPNTEYTINGTVGGNFTAKATNRVSGKIINFKFTWLGKQSRDGADFRALNSDNIQFTLKYNGTTPPNPPGGGGGGGGETTPNPPGRVDGDDRVETGVKISQKYYDKAKTVIVVRHDLFPDSMTASVLAKLKDAPILLNPTNKLDPRVGAEIKRLGAEEVIIVGGPDSISEKVRGDLKAYDKDKDVERIAGVDRYGTSEMVARRVTGITGKKNTGVIASGQVFPDALSVGTFASRDGYPILLVKKNLVPDQVVSAIKDLDIKKTYIAGGTNTISKSTEAKLPGVLERMAGKDRYETSVAIAKSKFKDSTEAFIASGEEFADALVISPVSGKYNRPTLLASRNKKTNAVVKKYIEESYLTSITAIGGEKYLPNSIMLDLAGK